MILAIIVAWLAYKKAKQAGRNGILWGLAGAAVYIGTQLIVSLIVGFALGVAILVFHWQKSIIDTASIPITLVAILASFLTSWLFLKLLDRMWAGVGTFEPPTYSILGRDD